MECGNCTYCCKFLEIKETSSKTGEYCKYCIPEVGCKIYNKRPESCKIFECCWKQMKVSAEELRPDRCNMLFEKWSDKVIVGATDKKMSELIMKQINYFNGEGISIVILDHLQKTKTFYLASGHTKEFVKQEINNSIKSRGN